MCPNHVISRTSVCLHPYICISPALPCLSMCNHSIRQSGDIRIIVYHVCLNNYQRVIHVIKYVYMYILSRGCFA